MSRVIIPRPRDHVPACVRSSGETWCQPGGPGVPVIWRHCAQLLVIKTAPRTESPSHKPYEPPTPNSRRQDTAKHLSAAISSLSSFWPHPVNSHQFATHKSDDKQHQFSPSVCLKRYSEWTSFKIMQLFLVFQEFEFQQFPPGQAPGVGTNWFSWTNITILK